MAHSLGTVVAYNALMDAEDILPNYLTHEEWTDRALQPFKKRVAPADECALPQEPRRPPWLAPGEGLERSLLFEHLEGFLTIGSPLNKFAALWPAIVPMHRDPVSGNSIPWVNVADAQDIVGGPLTLFANGISPGSPPGTSWQGLNIVDLACASANTPFTAHTSYWDPGKEQNRLVNRMIEWLEGTLVNATPMSAPSQVAAYRILRWVWIIISATICLVVAAEMSAILSVWMS
jgi:hypothetical protein